MSFLRILAAAGLPLLWAVRAGAQIGVYPPTSAECAEWTTPGFVEQRLAADGEYYGLDAAFWFCPSAGRTLAAVLLAARGKSDARYLIRLAREAERDPDLAAAALQVLGDAGAAEPARAAALLVIANQSRRAHGFGDKKGVALLTEPIDDARAYGSCGIVDRLDYRRGNYRPLPEDFGVQVARVLDPVMLGTGTSPLLRNLARCIRAKVYWVSEIPLQVDLSGMRVEHVCGGYFRVTNPVDWRFMFEIRRERRGGGLDDMVRYVGPFESSRMYFGNLDDYKPTFTVLYEGRVLKTVIAPETPCPAP